MRAHDYLDFHAGQRPDADFAICSGQQITYREARNQGQPHLPRTNRRGGQSLVIAWRSYKGIVLKTVLLFHGALKAGIVPTPINHRLLPSDWLRTCQDAQVKLLVCDAEFVPEVDKIRSQLKSVRSFIMTAGHPLPGWADFQDWASAHVPPARRTSELEKKKMHS